jgi:hypothetical protein
MVILAQTGIVLRKNGLKRTNKAIKKILRGFPVHREASFCVGMIINLKVQVPEIVFSSC